MAELPIILALGGDTVARAMGSTVIIARCEPGALREVARFDVDAVVSWLQVAPDGGSALVWGASGVRAWHWDDEAGHRLQATSSGARDAFGLGFAVFGGETLTLMAQNGRLQGFARDGRERLTANLKSPFSFYPDIFVTVPGGLLALHGHHFSDGLDTIVTVAVADIARDPSAIQEAFRRYRPIYDRAVRIAVGPCLPGAAVVLRDPEDEEVPDDEEDREELGDVENFTGLYIRDLDSGGLLERIAYTSSFVSGTRIVATPRVVAIQRAGMLDVVTRGSGVIRSVSARAVALDVDAARAALMHDDGVIDVVAVEALPAG